MEGLSPKAWGAVQDREEAEVSVSLSNLFPYLRRQHVAQISCLGFRALRLARISVNPIFSK